MIGINDLGAAHDSRGIVQLKNNYSSFPYLPIFSTTPAIIIKTYFKI